MAISFSHILGFGPPMPFVALQFIGLVVMGLGIQMAPRLLASKKAPVHIGGRVAEGWELVEKAFR